MKYLIILFLIITILQFKPLRLSEVEKLIPKTITVEVVGHLKTPGLFEVENYSTINDLVKDLELFEDSSLDHYSLTEQLVANQVISVGQKSKEKKISINSASKEELMSLRGVGEVMADRIITYRNENGGFSKLDDLKNVKGIGDKVFLNIKDFIIL